MTKIALSIAAIALLAVPAFAQNSSAPAKRQSGAATTSGSGAQVPRGAKAPGYMKGNEVYDCTGKYLGADPDSSIRLQLLRQGDHSCVE